MRDQQAEVRPRVRRVAERGVRAGPQVRRRWRRAGRRRRRYRRGRGGAARRQSGVRRLEAAVGRAGRGQPGHTGRVRPRREAHAGSDRGHMRGEAEGEEGVPGRVQQNIAAVPQRESVRNCFSFRVFFFFLRSKFAGVYEFVGRTKSQNPLTDAFFRP